MSSIEKKLLFRIYERCKQYQKIGVHEIRVKYLHDLFVLQSKYRDFNSFKVYILMPSLLEINQYSDIFLHFQEIRKDKKVISIQFKTLHNKVVDHQTFPYSKQALCEKIRSLKESF